MKKLTFEFIRESFEKEGYTLLSEKYTDAHSKLNYICPQGHKHNIIWNNWQQGQRCPFCSGVAKLSLEFIKKAFEKEGYMLLSKKYVNSQTKLYYICSKGHKHSVKWNHWQGGTRCPICGGQSKPSIEFIKKSFEKEGYTLLSEEYINNKTKLNYTCPYGHQHNITWHNWNQGNRCSTCHKNNITGQGHPNWKRGVSIRKVPLYDTYNPQLSYCEETRRDPNDLDLLQVRCAKCSEWYNPKLKSVGSRIYSLKNFNNGENRFYCSEECKHTCSIFGKKKYAANEKPSKTNPNFTSSELQTWSQEVLKRADYICEYCGAIAEHAHHIQPKKLEPFLALDPDNGVACCESCHYKHGHTGECSTGALANTFC